MIQASNALPAIDADPGVALANDRNVFTARGVNVSQLVGALDNLDSGPDGSMIAESPSL